MTHFTIVIPIGRVVAEAVDHFTGHLASAEERTRLTVRIGDVLSPDAGEAAVAAAATEAEDRIRAGEVAETLISKGYLEPDHGTIPVRLVLCCTPDALGACVGAIIELRRERVDTEFVLLVIDLNLDREESRAELVRVMGLPGVLTLVMGSTNVYAERFEPEDLALAAFGFVFTVVACNDGNLASEDLFGQAWALGFAGRYGMVGEVRSACARAMAARLVELQLGDEGLREGEPEQRLERLGSLEELTYRVAGAARERISASFVVNIEGDSLSIEMTAPQFRDLAPVGREREWVDRFRRWVREYDLIHGFSHRVAIENAARAAADALTRDIAAQIENLLDTHPRGIERAISALDRLHARVSELDDALEPNFPADLDVEPQLEGLEEAIDSYIPWTNRLIGVAGWAVPAVFALALAAYGFIGGLSGYLVATFAGVLGLTAVAGSTLLVSARERRRMFEFRENVMVGIAMHTRAVIQENLVNSLREFVLPALYEATSQGSEVRRSVAKIRELLEQRANLLADAAKSSPRRTMYRSIIESDEDRRRYLERTGFDWEELLDVAASDGLFGTDEDNRQALERFCEMQIDSLSDRGIIEFEEIDAESLSEILARQSAPLSDPTYLRPNHTVRFAGFPVAATEFDEAIRCVAGDGSPGKPIDRSYVYIAQLRPLDLPEARRQSA